MASPAHRQPTRQFLTVVWLAALIGVSAAGCGSGTGPTPPEAGFAGEWRGVIAQVGEITFSVSPDHRVTTIEIDYALSGCSGASTFVNLTVEIGRASAPPVGDPRAPVPATSDPSFFFNFGAPGSPAHTQIYGSFTSSTTAHGYVLLDRPHGCGNVVVMWSATRRSPAGSA